MRKPEDYTLVATLWYSRIENGKPNSNLVITNTTPEVFAGSDVRSLYTSPNDPLGFGPLGNKFYILIQGIRIPAINPNSAIDKPTFYEIYSINVPNGSFNASAIYIDFGTEKITTNEEETFMINGGTGIFEDAKIAIIKYDNTGDIFGFPQSRRIEVFKYK